MYRDIKKVSRSKGYLIDAIKAVKNGEDSKYFKEGLELVGVNLDSDFLMMSQVLADPYLSINLNDDVGLTFEIRLKPENDKDPILEVLELVLETTSTGMFQGGNNTTTSETIGEEELVKLSSMLVPSESIGIGNDPLVTLFFSEDSVKLQRFKLLEDNYYLFSLTDSAQLDVDIYEHTLNILFKDRDSSFETFFSAFVGSNLGKRETHRILESISQNNITGFFVGGVSLKVPSIDTLTYSTSNTRMIYDPEGEKLTIRTGDTSYIGELSRLRHAEVRVNDVGKYTVALHFAGDVELDIYMG